MPNYFQSFHCSTSILELLSAKMLYKNRHNQKDLIYVENNSKKSFGQRVNMSKPFAEFILWSPIRIPPTTLGGTQRHPA